MVQPSDRGSLVSEKGVLSLWRRLEKRAVAATTGSWLSNGLGELAPITEMRAQFQCDSQRLSILSEVVLKESRQTGRLVEFGRCLLGDFDIKTRTVPCSLHPSTSYPIKVFHIGRV